MLEYCKKNHQTQQQKNAKQRILIFATSDFSFIAEYLLDRI